MWLDYYCQLRLSTGGIDKTNQKELGGLAEVKHEVYLHNLAKLAVIGIILGVVFLLFWYAVSGPRFNEQYVLGLLTKHDPTIATAKLTWTDVVQENDQTFSELGTYDYFNDSSTIIGWRGAEVFRNDSGVIGGHIVSISGGGLPIAAENSTKWLCPDGTVLEISTAETPNYFYIGANGTALMRSALEMMDSDPEDFAWLSTMQEIISNASSIPGINSTNVSVKLSKTFDAVTKKEIS